MTQVSTSISKKEPINIYSRHTWRLTSLQCQLHYYLRVLVFSGQRVRNHFMADCLLSRRSRRALDPLYPNEYHVSSLSNNLYIILLHILYTLKKLYFVFMKPKLSTGHKIGDFSSIYYLYVQQGLLISCPIYCIHTNVVVY